MRPTVATGSRQKLIARSIIGSLTAMLVLSNLCGCITETTSPTRGTPVKPASRSERAAQSQAKSKAASTAEKAVLPTGPVARPERGKMTATDIRVEVQPLGSIGYDGQALPLVSPDGNFLVSQEGQPPSWAAILAQSGAEVPGQTRLVVHNISKVPSSRVDLPSPLPSGLMLGRSADASGFLVESPQPGGSRWIGRVDWMTGALTWLVQGDAVNSHGVLSPKGELLYVRRPINSIDGTLVLRTQSGFEATKNAIDGTYAYPMFVGGSEAAFIFRLARGGTDLEVVRIDRSNDDRPRLADTRQQWRVAPSPDMVIAHQMSSTQVSTPAGVVPSDPTEGDVAVLFDPRTSRMARFNSRTGSVEGLLARTIGAAPATGPGTTPGYFCTGEQGLMFIARPEAGWPAAWPQDGPAARVLASPYIARLIQAGPNEVPMYLLVGPFKSDPTRLEITKMAVVPPEAAPTAK